MPTRTHRDTPEDNLSETIGASEAAAIADVARQSTPPTEIAVLDHTGEPAEARLYGYHPDEGHQLVETVDLERRRLHPADKAGTVEVKTPEALIRYADRHINVGADDATLWGDIDGGSVVVVLNDHASRNGGGQPGWGDHRVKLQLERSPEWEAWTKIASGLVSQVELAEFLEEHVLEVKEPSGSDLLEVTQTLHVTSGARFKSAMQLHSGEQQLVYEEDVQAQAGRTGNTDVPTDLVLLLRPWIGVERVEVAAKFRFRVREGRLGVGVKLLNLEEHSRQAVTDALAHVQDRLVIDAIEGRAPAARR